jgi:hypothetical protein
MRTYISGFLAAALFAAPACLHSQAFINSSASLSSPGDSGGSVPDTNTKNSKKKFDAKKQSDDLLSMRIQDATLAIDGFTAKVHLDYKLDGDQFLYFYIPGEGTAVVSRIRTPNSVEVKDAFRGDKLAFSTGGHDFELVNTSNLVNHGSSSAWVRMDTDTSAKALGKYPMMGYGVESAAPYAWPVALPATREEEKQMTSAAGVTVPRVPRSMLPIRASVTTSEVPPVDGAK